MQCHLVVRHYICELCNAILLQGIIYVNYAMLSCCKALCMWIRHRHGAKHHICELSHAIFFFITYSICRQSMYIELLFMCISHLSRLWKNLEWKQGLQSRQWYLLKHISRWLQGAPQRRIQRQMTNPTPPGACSNLAGLCCSYRVYGILHCYVICLV